MEVRAWVRYRALDLISIDVAAGVGVVSGVGHAGWRLISGNDRDGDGTPNAIGDFPSRAEGYDGCPDAFEHVEVGCDVIFLLTLISFEGRTDTLSSVAEAVLDEVVASLAASGATGVRVESHTDSAGDTGENFAVSERQAEAVVDDLAGVGVMQELDASGMGEEMPLAGNDTEAGRAENRRIEVHLSGGCD